MNSAKISGNLEISINVYTGLVFGLSLMFTPTLLKKFIVNHEQDFLNVSPSWTNTPDWRVSVNSAKISLTGHFERPINFRAQ